MELIFMDRNSNQGTTQSNNKSEKSKKEYAPLTGRVLVVDDEEDVRDILNFYLSGWKVSVSEAHDGDMAIEKLKNDSFDLIITDLNMPKMRGDILISEVKNRNLSTAKIVVATGGIDSTYFEAAKEMSDGLILKPFDKKLIYQTVEKFLKKEESGNL